MHKLTKIMIPALAAATMLGTAGTASAQHYPAPHYPAQSRHAEYHMGHGTPARAEAIRNQLAQLEMRVNRNDNRDRISEREAASLRREIRDVRSQLRAFNRNGLDNREFRILETRIDRVRDRLHIERSDRDGRRW